jgi:hypothetical protein
MQNNYNSPATSSNSNSNFNYDHTSFIDKLYTSNEISERTFILNLVDELSPKFHIGKLPQHISADIKNLSTCKTKKSLGNWNCLISHVLFGNDFNFYKAISVNVHAVFASGINNIAMPTEYIDLFMNNYFKSFKLNNNNKFCFTKANAKNIHILCDRNYLETGTTSGVSSLPSLNFIINGFAYRIPAEDLFEEVYSEANSQFNLFKIFFTETSQKQWILGTTFLKQFEVVFNKDKEEVGFYSNPLSGAKYDFTKFTSDDKESFCFYNYSAYFILASIVLMSMCYVYWTKRKRDEIIIHNYIKYNRSNKT